MTSTGDFTFVAAPVATWFNGEATSEDASNWMAMASTYCGSLFQATRSPSADNIVINYEATKFDKNSE